MSTMTLAALAKILSRMEPTSAVRSLLRDVRTMIAHDRATVAECNDVVARAESLGVTSSMLVL